MLNWPQTLLKNEAVLQPRLSLFCSGKWWCYKAAAPSEGFVKKQSKELWDDKQENTSDEYMFRLHKFTFIYLFFWSGFPLTFVAFFFCEAVEGKISLYSPEKKQNQWLGTASWHTMVHFKRQRLSEPIARYTISENQKILTFVQLNYINYSADITSELELETWTSLHWPGSGNSTITTRLNRQSIVFFLQCIYSEHTESLLIYMEICSCISNHT